MDPRADFGGREIRLWGQQAQPFSSETTARADYVAHPLEARPRPEARAPGQPLPFDGSSTYTDAYHAHALPSRQHHQGGQHNLVRGTAPFDGTTSYKSDYVPHQLDRQGPAQSRTGERVNLPFEGTSSYRSEYPAHAMPQRPVAQGGPYIPSSAPFDGASTYKGDYVTHAMEARPHQSPAQPRETLPFDASSTYSDNFRPYPIQPHAAPKHTQYQANPARFEGTSESMDKYRAWAIDPANRRGAGPPPMRPSLPFDGTTTHKEMFLGWQLPPRRPGLGVQMVGDVAYMLIPPSASLPAVGKQLFTTVHDNQADIRILVLQGEFTQASRCEVLGFFDMTGMPPGPKGSAKVEITFHVDAAGVLNVSAMDLNTQRQEQWLRQGWMVVNCQ